MSLLDWWLNFISNGEHYREIQREKDRQHKREERLREKQERIERLRAEFVEQYPTLISQSWTTSSSTGDTAHCTSVSTPSAPTNSCGGSCSSNSCGGSSSCGGGGGGGD